MVVLDGGTMVSLGSTQYLQPDYLSPLPTTVSTFLHIFLFYNFKQLNCYDDDEIQKNYK